MGSDNLRKVLLVGATGLVGRATLARLLEDPGVGQVVTLTRRPLADAPVTRRLRAEVVEFDRLAERPELFAVDQVICALGTTMKQAGSQAAFRRVDHDYVLEVARLARAQGARHFLVVSSLGASPRSRVFYSRVKGEVEADLEALGYPSLSIVRPSLLLGDRAEARPGERLSALMMTWLGPLVPAKVRGIPADDVARALVRLAREDAAGVRVVTSAEMRAWASGE